MSYSKTIPQGPQGEKGPAGPPGPSIPFDYTYSQIPLSTTSTSWVDMPAMSVSITLAQTSHILIMFSGEVWMETAGDYLLLRALVDSTVIPINSLGSEIFFPYFGHFLASKLF